MSEESLDIELSAWLFSAKTLGVNAPCHTFIFVDFLDFDHWFAFQTFRQGFLSLDTGIIFYHVESSTFFERIDDGGEWLEVAHTLERVDDINRNWEILMAFDLCEEKFVLKQVRVGEVEFDLCVVSQMNSVLLMRLHRLVFG